MRHLQAMLEHLRTEGYINAFPDATHKSGLKLDFEKPNQAEWDAFAKVEPFVFADEPHVFDATKPSDFKWVRGSDKDSEIDAPFPVFSIECLNGPLDTYTVGTLTRNGVECEGELGFTLCTLVIEIEPKEYGYYTYCHHTTKAGAPRGYSCWKSNCEGPTVKHYLQRLNREQMGMESVRQIVKLGSGKAKQSRRIKRIIHVSPKKYISAYSGGTRDVNWSHRWEVRGHWRKLDGLGKDRDGNYSVNGFTWVDHYEKGPADLPLIKKTRFIKDAE